MAEPRERKIEELEKENAELTERLEDLQEQNSEMFNTIALQEQQIEKMNFVRFFISSKSR